MFWTIFWAFIGTLCACGVSYLAWEVAKGGMTPRKMLMARTGFISLSIVSSFSIAMLSYLSGRAERAHFSVAPSGQTFLQPGQPIRIRVDLEDVGTGPSINSDTYSRTFIEDDNTKINSADAVERFKPFWAAHDVGANPIPKGQKGVFMTAQGPVLGVDDVNNIMNNIKVVYVIGRIDFKDDFGKHTQNICKYLQRPVSSQTMIWGTCGMSEDEQDRHWWQ